MIWPDRLAQLHAFQFSHVAQRAQRLLCDHLDTTGLRMQHYRVLAGLAELGQTTQAALSKALSLDAGSLVSLLADLEKLDAITREPDPSNRRRNLVRCAPNGQRLLHRMDEAVSQANDLLLESFSIAERDQLHEFLTRISARSESAAGMPGPVCG
jgi:DNA-binding MarR family transcriptional regulator